jgi:gliding motility-associated-like protein
MKNIKYWIAILTINIIVNTTVVAQISVTFNADTNYICNGFGCNYSGPSILINEVMLTPIVGDGSIFDLDNTRRAEWIELYNPDLCRHVDISCYYLGNNAPDPANYGGGYRIPNNTVVPPGGFVVIRGTNAPAVPANLLVQNGGTTIELIVDNGLGNVCMDAGANRLWFPNAGGWFAFYNNIGVPQDAISWNSQTSSCMTCSPCISTCMGCPNAASLPSYSAIPAILKNYITNLDPSMFAGQSWKRIPDGATWSGAASAPTIGTCNSICNPPAVITCNGQATVTPSGGTPPYSFVWNDPQATITALASGLCEGFYTVTVTDAASTQKIDSVYIVNYKPHLSFNNVDPICIDGNTISLNPYVSPPGGNFVGNGITGSDFSPQTAGIGSHPISYIYSDINTCIDTIIKTVQVKPLPVITPTISPVLCNNESSGQINLVVSVGQQPYTYSWSPNVSSNQTATGLAAGTYTVTVTDAIGCTATQSVTLINPPPISIALTPKDETCPMFCNGQIDIAITGNAPPYSYLWSTSPAQTTQTATNLCAGNYFVTVSYSPNNCKIESNASIITTTNVTADFTANPIEGFVPLTVNFTYTGFGASTYSWVFSDGGTSNIQNPTHTYAIMGLYPAILTVSSGPPNNCEATHQIIITAIQPSSIQTFNIITPNGDGMNDEFSIESEGIRTIKVEIFNRWGEKVYVYNNNEGFTVLKERSKLWTGDNMNGKPCADGTYFYIIDAKGYDSKEYHINGNVTLIR